MDTEFVETELNGFKLRVFKDGTIMRYVTKTGGGFNMGWQICNLVPNKYSKYIQIALKNKSYKVHRIIGMVYLGLDINNPNLQVDHIDRCRTNNNINNLRIVTNQENMWNTTRTGYSWHTRDEKWTAYININKKRIHLGSFNTEEEARNAYLEAKQKYHIISHHPNHLHPK